MKIYSILRLHAIIYNSFIHESQIWEQPKCPSPSEWIIKLWHIYNISYYSMIKRLNYWYMQLLREFQKCYSGLAGDLVVKAAGFHTSNRTVWALDLAVWKIGWAYAHACPESQEENGGQGTASQPFTPGGGGGVGGAFFLSFSFSSP